MALKSLITLTDKPQLPDLDPELPQPTRLLVSAAAPPHTPIHVHRPCAELE